MFNQTNKSRMRGFSMVELMIVIAIIFILLASALFAIQPTLRNARADTASSYALNQIRQARERAVDERHQFLLSFTAPRTITLQQLLAGNPPAYAQPNAPSSQYSQINLPFDINYQVPGTLPAQAPDGFGAGANAVDFTVAGGAGGTTLTFHPDGSITDPNNAFTNGVVYVSRPGDITSCRAVSVFGATGRVKSWRLTVNAGGTTKWGLQ